MINLLWKGTRVRWSAELFWLIKVVPTSKKFEKRYPMASVPLGARMATANADGSSAVHQELFVTLSPKWRQSTPNLKLQLAVLNRGLKLPSALQHGCTHPKVGQRAHNTRCSAETLTHYITVGWQRWDSKWRESKFSKWLRRMEGFEKLRFEELQVVSIVHAACTYTYLFLFSVWNFI
jgi:hypothetical protein